MEANICTSLCGASLFAAALWQWLRSTARVSLAAGRLLFLPQGYPVLKSIRHRSPWSKMPLSFVLVQGRCTLCPQTTLFNNFSRCHTFAPLAESITQRISWSLCKQMRFFQRRRSIMRLLNLRRWRGSKVHEILWSSCKSLINFCG